MKIARAASTVDELGPLTRRVYGFVDTQKEILAAGVTKESAKAATA